ncbi:histidine kinase N-terminal 7TM domain-containing protein [Haladaptatus sp. DJG-WS-42]|uniref:histidine kinase N-terminal 7TM domain-containing protein n=1 Tax=Haladaptatus sp. DJG-WS-42 TaxID=3120516 RepID=UPI0030D4C0CD
MAWQATPYTFPLLLASAISLLLSVYVLSHRSKLKQPRMTAFLAVTGSVVVWCSAYWFQLSTTTLAGKLFWNRFVWIGVAVMAVAWPVFILAYAGRQRWLTPGGLLSISVFPAATALLVWSAEYRQLVFTPVNVHTHSTGVVLEISPGPVFLLFLLYTYILDLVVIGVLALDAHRTYGIRRRQSLLLILASVVPLLASWASVAEVFPFPHVDLTPITFGLTTPLVAYTLFRYQFLDVIPIAQRTLIDEMDDGIIILDDNHRIVDYNPTVTRLLDTGTDLVGERAETALAAYPALHECLVNEGAATEIVTTNDETPRYYSVTCSQFETQNKSGSILSLHDITTQRKVERRYQTIVEQASTVTVLVTEDGRFEYVTPSIERTLGYPPVDILGDPFIEYIHPDDVERIFETFITIQQGGTSDWVELRVQHADGSWRVMEAKGENLLENPAIGAILLTAHDVTEHRQYEQRLQVLNRVLRHDVGNKMSVVQGAISMVQEETESEQVRTWMGKAHRAGTDLLELSQKSRRIDTLLDRDSEVLPLDIVAQVEQVVATVQTTYSTVNIECDIPDAAWANALPLVKVGLEELLTNAIEHSDRDVPTVTVSITKAETDVVEIHVADDGPGIPKMEREVLKRGIESQLEHTSGLGLWLVHWIVSAADGELVITENEPRGTVVTLRFHEAAPVTAEATTTAQD